MELRRLLIAHTYESSFAQWLGGTFLLVISASMLFSQISMLANAKQDIAPLVSTLPSLEERRALLEEQIEVGEIHSALRNGAGKEMLSAYVLPDEPRLSRLLGFFDALRNTLSKDALLIEMSDVSIGERSEQGDMAEYPVDVTLTVTRDIADDVLLFFEHAGALHVYDVLSPAERNVLVQASEQENVTGIASLEQFFATDLLTYARDTRAIEDRVLGSFSSPAFLETFLEVRNDAVLSMYRRFLGGDLGRELKEEQLWPLQFLQIDTAAMRFLGPDTVRIALSMQLVERTK